MSRVWRYLVLLLLAATAACGDSHGPSKPVPGILRVVLTTPNPDDGAVLLTLTAPAAPTVLTAAAGLRLFQSGQPGTTTTVALTGPLQGGTILMLQVPDTRKAKQYRATLQQVSSSGFQLRNLSGYRLKVRD